MSQRLDFFAASPKAMETILNQEKYIATCYKEKQNLSYHLVELVKIRVSQINGCAYCIDMHTKDAKYINETDQRIFNLSAWSDCPFYTAEEKAALEWAEVITKVSSERITDKIFDNLKKHFDEEQIVDLTLVVTTINSWNRIVKSFRPQVGDYQPGRR